MISLVCLPSVSLRKEGQAVVFTLFVTHALTLKALISDRRHLTQFIIEDIYGK